MIKDALQEEIPSTWKVFEEFHGILNELSKQGTFLARFSAGFYQYFAMNLHGIFETLKNTTRFYKVWVFGVFLSPDFIYELKIA